MSRIVKKCPKDGIVYDAKYGKACESCFGPLQYYCETHSQWLVDENCNLCTKSVVAPTGTDSVKSSPSSLSWGTILLAIGAFAFLMIVVTLILALAYRMIRPQKKSAAPAVTSSTTPPPQPVQAPFPKPVAAPPPPQPVAVIPPQPKPLPSMPPAAEIFPSYPPIETGIADILLDPDKYLGKLVKVSGTIQLKEIEKTSFELRQRDRTIQVFYANVPATMKSAVAAASDQQQFTVTGLLKLDETYNSYFILAQQVEVR